VQIMLHIPRLCLALLSSWIIYSFNVS